MNGIAPVTGVTRPRDATGATGTAAAPMVERVAHVRGAPVRYWVAGPLHEGREAVVLLHGLSGSSRWWRPVLPALAGRYAAHLVDLPGFGSARRVRGTLDDTVAWLREWLAAAGPDKAHVVAHSMGGYVAARLAAEHPEVVDRLVLVAPALLSADPHWNAAWGVPGARSLVRRVGPLARSGRAIAKRFFPVLAYDALRAGPLTTLRRTRELLAATDREHLSRIRASTLLVWGEHDALVPPAIGWVLREEIPGARLLVLRGAGHVPMYERPAALNDALLRFLAGEPVGE